MTFPFLSACQFVPRLHNCKRINDNCTSYSCSCRNHKIGQIALTVSMEIVLNKPQEIEINSTTYSSFSSIDNKPFIKGSPSLLYQNVSTSKIEVLKRIFRKYKFLRRHNKRHFYIIQRLKSCSDHNSSQTSIEPVSFSHSNNLIIIFCN